MYHNRRLPMTHQIKLSKSWNNYCPDLRRQLKRLYCQTHSRSPNASWQLNVTKHSGTTSKVFLVTRIWIQIWGWHRRTSEARLTVQAHHSKRIKLWHLSRVGQKLNIIRHCRLKQHSKRWQLRMKDYQSISFSHASNLTQPVKEV